MQIADDESDRSRRIVAVVSGRRHTGQKGKGLWLERDIRGKGSVSSMGAR